MTIITPPPLKTRLKKEQEEEEENKKEKDEAHLYTIIKVARDEDLREQIGKDTYFDLVDHDKVRSFRIENQSLFTAFKKEIAKEFGIPVRFQRYWFWGKRQNHTYRANRPLMAHEELQTVCALREVPKKAHNAELRLFLDVELGVDLGFARRLSPPGKSRDDILIFFKLYDPEKEDLRYVGRMFVKVVGKPIEIIAKLNELAGFADNEEIELYEEIKFEPNILCEPIDKRTSFRSSELGDGDIICFQKAIISESEANYPYPDVPSFFELVHNRQMRMKKVQEEEEYKKEKAEAHCYTIIKVARDEDLREQIGKDIYFDLVDQDKVRSFRIQKQLPFTAFKEEVAKEFSIPVQFQRYWFWGKRQNHTYRPNRPLTAHEELQTVGALRKVPNKAHNAELKLFLEVEPGVASGLSWRLFPLGKSQEDILIFFKLYNPEKEDLRYVGRMFVKEVGKPIQIIAKLNELAGFADNEEIKLYKEIKFEPNIMCKPIDKRISFRSSQLGDGDIICFQKAIISESEANYRYPDVPSFLEHVHNRQMRLKKDQEEEYKKKEKNDDRLYTIIKVARDEDLLKQIGKDLYFDLVNHDKVRSFRIEKQSPFTAFKEEVAKEFGIPVRFQRYWFWAKRKNDTYRPDRPLMACEELQTVGTLRGVTDEANTAELNLFLEVELGVDLGFMRRLYPPGKSRDDILIFFKLYDPEKEDLRYVGRMFVKEVGKPIEIGAKLNELAGFPDNEEIELYEEIRFEPNIMCEPIDKTISFRISELGDGDIICFQKAIISESEAKHRYPDVPSFLEHLHNRQWLWSTGPGLLDTQDVCGIDFWKPTRCSVNCHVLT